MQLIPARQSYMYAQTGWLSTSRKNVLVLSDSRMTAKANLLAKWHLEDSSSSHTIPHVLVPLLDSLPQHSLAKPQRYPNISRGLYGARLSSFSEPWHKRNSSVPQSLENCHSRNLATVVQPPPGKEIRVLVCFGFFL